MVYSGRFDQKVEAFSEDELRKKINKAVFGLELKISFDLLTGSHEVKLRDEKGNSYNISMKTLDHYHELRSLLEQYHSNYGNRPEFEAAKQKWHYFPN